MGLVNQISLLCGWEAPQLLEKVRYPVHFELYPSLYQISFSIFKYFELNVVRRGGFNFNFEFLK